MKLLIFSDTEYKSLSSILLIISNISYEPPKIAAKYENHLI